MKNSRQPWNDGIPRTASGEFDVQAIIDMPPPEFPDLGDDSKVILTLHITEAEANTIQALYGFARGATVDAPIPVIMAWWEHYGKISERISKRVDTLTPNVDERQELEDFKA